MNAKLIMIISFSILYACFELFMSRRQKGLKSAATTGDKGSIWFIILAISVGYWLSFIIGATKIGRVHPWNVFFTIGFAIILIGLIIRINAILTLQKQFTYTVTKVENHELIETGLYKYIRHPGYLGQLIIFTGIATTLSNWLSILCMIIPVLAGYIYRIQVEEKFMIKQIGQTYIEYQKHTKRLIPAVY